MLAYADMPCSPEEAVLDGNGRCRGFISGDVSRMPPDVNPCRRQRAEVEAASLRPHEGSRPAGDPHHNGTGKNIQAVARIGIVPVTAPSRDAALNQPEDSHEFYPWIRQKATTSTSNHCTALSRAGETMVFRRG